MVPELWLKIGTYLHPDSMYYVGGCCSGPWRAAPGAGAVGPWPSIMPPEDLLNLSSVCRILRSIFESDVKGSLSLCVRVEDGVLIHQRGSSYPRKDNQYNVEETHKFATLPLGNHIRYLRLAIRDNDFGYHDFQELTKRSQEYCDAAALIFHKTSHLQSLVVSARFGHCGNDFNLSLIFCQALASLTNLRILKLEGLSIPADCPVLTHVKHIQTNAMIHSFKCLPQLTDLRQDPDMFALGYNIPKDTLARLEVLHYCSPDYIYERTLLPQVCRVCISLNFAQHKHKLMITSTRRK
jgi:hypothetical protein